MTLELRPSLLQRQAECLREIHPLQASLEEASKKLEILNSRVERIQQSIEKNPGSASRSVLQSALQEQQLAEITQQAARLAFTKKVTEYFWAHRGTKDRLVNELYPNNLEAQEAFSEEIDAAPLFFINSDLTPPGKRHCPVEQVMDDRY